MNTDINETLTSNTSINEPESIEEIQQKINDSIDASSQLKHYNRAERRKLAKKLGKSGRAKMGTISETAKKLNYIDLIQKLREMNKENENENATKNN